MSIRHHHSDRTAHSGARGFRSASFAANSADFRAEYTRSERDHGRRSESKPGHTADRSTGSRPARLNAAEGQFLHNGVRFCSRSEAACAALMERYLPNFKTQPGVNFQVPLGLSQQGNMRFADFLVNDVIVEFHPPRIWTNARRHGDFSSRQDAVDYFSTMRELPKQQRQEFKAQTIERLKENYYNERRQVIDGNPKLRDKELVVTASASEFYDQILCRFAISAPPKEQFLREFKAILGRVQDLSEDNRQSRSERRRQQRGRVHRLDDYRKKRSA